MTCAGWDGLGEGEGDGLGEGLGEGEGVGAGAAQLRVTNPLISTSTVMRMRVFFNVISTSSLSY
jgi:hypothetical protein